MGRATEGEPIAVPAQPRATRGPGRAGSLLVGLAVVVLVAGCGGDPERGTWSARESLTSCGDVRLGAGDLLEEATRDGVRCLQKALGSGQGAELRVALTTVEGDPVTQYFRVTSSGRFEIYTDATHDTYGSGRWEYQDCGPRESLSRLSC